SHTNLLHLSDTPFPICPTTLYHLSDKNLIFVRQNTVCPTTCPTKNGLSDTLSDKSVIFVRQNTICPTLCPTTCPTRHDLSDTIYNSNKTVTPSPEPKTTNTCTEMFHVKQFF